MKPLLWLGILGLASAIALPRPAQAQNTNSPHRQAKKHKRHHHRRHHKNHHKGHLAQDRYPQQ